jgi:hypothetical protein
MVSCNEKMRLETMAARASANPPLYSYATSDFNKEPSVMLETETCRILERVDTRGISIPKWRNVDLWDAIFDHTLGYKNFVALVESMDLVPVDRLHMEAHWMKLLMRKYASFDPRSESKSRGRLINRKGTFIHLLQRKKYTLCEGFNSVGVLMCSCSESLAD